MHTDKNQNISETNTQHICVALRVRPLLNHEVDRGEREEITVLPKESSDQACSGVKKTLETSTDRGKSLSSSPSSKVKAQKEKRKSLKGGVDYAAHVHLSAMKSNERRHPKTSFGRQFNDLECISEVFSFDAVLGPGATQTDVFDLLRLYTYCDDAMLEGKAAAIMCYGQTGSGKSFTMSGPFTAAGEDHTDNSKTPQRISGQASESTKGRIALIEESGIAYQAVRYIAQCLQKLQQSTHPDTGLKLVARASYMELYQERIRDLLQARYDLKCRWSSERRAFYVENLLQVECCTEEDFLLILREGQSQRQQAAHALNATSSRSHTIFTINFEMTNNHLQIDNAVGEPYTRYGKLTFVDLAGSERLKDTGNTANDDTKAINRSLFALSNVIQTLSTQTPNLGTSSTPQAALENVSNQTDSICAKSETTHPRSLSEGKGGLTAHSFVPYRSSILTKLLMDSLEGNSRTLFIVCVTPSSRFLEESLRTLHFAQRARRIRSIAVERVDSKVKEHRHFVRTISRLKAENALLRAALNIPPDLNGLLTENVVMEHVNELVVRHTRNASNGLFSAPASSKTGLPPTSKACQASLSPDFERAVKQTLDAQKGEYGNEKAPVDELKGDVEAAPAFQLSSSQQWAGALPHLQCARPYSSLPHYQLHERHLCNNFVPNRPPIMRQGRNALDILKDLPDTTCALIGKPHRAVAPTRYDNDTICKRNTQARETGPCVGATLGA